MSVLLPADSSSVENWIMNGIKTFSDFFRFFNIEDGSHFKVYFVFGLCRSGHHAIINWILRQSGNSLHVNCLNIDFEANVFFLNSSYCHSYINNSHKDRFRLNKIDMVIPEYKKDIDTFLFNFEKCSGPVFELFMKREDVFPEGCAVQYILVRRDRLNWLASCLKHKHSIGHIKSANTMLEEYNILSSSGVDSFVDVFFNKWFSCKEYRKQLAEKLGLEFTDLGIDDVVDAGGGSSFDRQRFDGRAQEMDVLDRWKEYKDDELYSDLILQLYGII